MHTSQPKNLRARNCRTLVVSTVRSLLGLAWPTPIIFLFGRPTFRDFRRFRIRLLVRFHLGEQLGQGHPQRRRNLQNSSHRRYLRLPLQDGNVRTVEAGLFRQLFLVESRDEPPPVQYFGKTSLEVGEFHEGPGLEFPYPTKFALSKTTEVKCYVLRRHICYRDFCSLRLDVVPA